MRSPVVRRNNTRGSLGCCQVPPMQVMGQDEGERILAVELDTFELNTDSLTGEVTVPSIQYHSIEKHPWIALAVRL